MKKSTLDQVREFHETYGLPVEDAPSVSDEKTNALRINLLAEELDELKKALANNDPLEALDALIEKLGGVEEAREFLETLRQKAA